MNHVQRFIDQVVYRMLRRLVLSASTADDVRRKAARAVISYPEWPR